MRSSKKRKVLSLEQKLEVCKRVDSSDSFEKIAENFGVNLSTISDIYSSKRQLIDFVSHIDTSSQKRMKRPQKVHLIQRYTCGSSRNVQYINQIGVPFFKKKH
ncbi:Jerky protein [Trichinella murrelli]|uniref:Jerky protein n=1 Tax=Trichinella murrelli TaxID=144512 RepID=A0A0V0T7D7_9BILA|nr:Jerky protein [Trichinella murrelli]